jgi:hypothetical protein
MSVSKLTVAGRVHPGGTATLASPPPLDTCPPSGEPPPLEPVPLEPLLELTPGAPPPLGLPVAAIGAEPLSTSLGMADPPPEEPAPLTDEVPFDDELPLLPGPLAPVAPLELPDDSPPLMGLPSTPDDDPPADGALESGGVPDWEELHAIQMMPAPRTTNRPARCECAG